MTTYLFVGGSLHGQVRAVEDHLTDYRAIRLNPNTPMWDPVAGDLPPTILDVYTRCTLASRYAGAWTVMAIQDPPSEAEVLDALLYTDTLPGGVTRPTGWPTQPPAAYR